MFLVNAETLEPQISIFKAFHPFDESVWICLVVAYLLYLLLKFLFPKKRARYVAKPFYQGTVKIAIAATYSGLILKQLLNNKAVP